MSKTISLAAESADTGVVVYAPVVPAPTELPRWLIQSCPDCHYYTILDTLLGGQVGGLYFCQADALDMLHRLMLRLEVVAGMAAAS